MIYKNRSKLYWINLSPLLLIVIILVSFSGCSNQGKSDELKPKISIVNVPADILTMGAYFLAEEITKKSEGKIKPKVYHSGVLSGGKGIAEIEMCQQGSIEIHITTTAYLANLVPKTSIVSLPFLFRNIDQVIGLTKSYSPVLEVINKELNGKSLHIIAWWPRGFRQLTNSKRPVKTIDDLKGLTFRVMNNPLYTDIMNVMGANPVPMEWSEVYNALQLKTIDGQENAEDVISTNKLYETQKYMTVWDYSTDIEVVLVSFSWWNNLTAEQRKIIQEVADASIDYQVGLLKKNISDLRKLIEEKGMEINYISEENKAAFREAVEPVWIKYEKIFTKQLLEDFMDEIQNY
ncbi:MAG: TRAP transporter substrate-binding protein [Mariniphaga sp.]|nr:TRAP transporter substrate-binding protein [Mariniphaga sp.]